MSKSGKIIKSTIKPEEFKKMDTVGKIMEFSQAFETPAGKSKEEVLEAILNNKTQKTSKVISLTRFIQAAAAVAIIVVGFYSVNEVFSKEKISTGIAEQTEFRLPDQSEVVLNADSRITYSEKKFNESRELTLKGEAYFDVQKGASFKITTANGTVEVLGTQLNVFSRKDEFWVSCVSGRVRVSTSDDEQIIVPGEMVQLSGHKLVKQSKLEIENTISWKDGVFYFEDKPLVSIFAALERQFNVTVELKSDQDRSMTVMFTNESLQEALDIVCLPMDLEYEIRNNKIRIFEKPK